MEAHELTEEEVEAFLVALRSAGRSLRNSVDSTDCNRH